MGYLVSAAAAAATALEEEEEEEEDMVWVGFGAVDRCCCSRAWGWEVYDWMDGRAADGLKRRRGGAALLCVCLLGAQRERTEASASRVH